MLDREANKLWGRATQGEPVGELRFTLSSRQGTRARAREVVRQVWAQAVQLLAGEGGFVQASCSVVCETPDVREGKTH